MKKPLLLTPMIAALALSIVPLADQVLKNADHDKLAKMISACFESRDTKKDINVTAQKLQEEIEKLTKKQKGANALAWVEDWEIAFRKAEISGLDDKAAKGGVERSFPSKGGSGDIKIAIYPPAKYSPKNGPYPLVLCVPEMGKTPKEYLDAEWADVAQREGVILVAVEMPANPAAWAVFSGETPSGIVAIMFTFGHLLEHWAVDQNRVFLASSGEEANAAAFTVASYYPHRFAGLISRGGGPKDLAEKCCRNLRWVPMLMRNSGEFGTACKDRIDKLGYDNCTLAPEGTEADAWAFVRAHVRKAYPEKISFAPAHAQATRADWINLLGVQIENASLEASADRGTNTIDLTVEGVSTVQLYLNDRIVDLDKPMRIVINGVVTEISQNRSARTMLDIGYNQRDWGRVYTTLPTPFNVKPKDAK